MSTDLDRTVVFTIVAANYLPMAQVLGESVLMHHPEARFIVVVIDAADLTVLEVGAGAEWWGVAKVCEFVDEFFAMATLYDVTEFATALKPFVARQLLSEADVVLYIDPDIAVYDSLDRLFTASVDRGVSLTPHCLKPMRRDAFTPSEHDIMQSGVYNLGYVGIGQAGLPFLDWWCERLARDAIIDPSNQLFTDQRWIDIAVPIFDPHIERSPAYNVAYWNLDQRPMELIGDRIEVCGEPLKFFHFSGFDPVKPWWLSKHHPLTPRNLVSSSRALTILCEEYSRRVLAAKESVAPAGPYRWNEPIPGMPLTREMRRLFRQEVIAADNGDGPCPPNPYEHGAVAFLGWLASAPKPGGLPRYARIVLESRADLRHEFGRQVDAGDYSALLGWIERQGVGDFPWLALLDRRPVVDSAPASEITGPVTRVLGIGVDVVGYLRSEHGVGEAGRLATLALTAAGVPVSTISSSRTLSRQEADFKIAGSEAHGATLLAVNADQTAIVAADLGPSALDGSYVIGQWFWELEDFPDSYADAFAIVDEVWVATEFVAQAVRRRAPDHVRVEVMPLPLIAPAVAPDFRRSDLGLDERVMFLFSFDFLSIVNRKNPKGLIEAFTSAFGESDGAQLVIKTINGSRNLNALEELRWLSRHRTDVTIIDGYLDRPVAAALTASADCYVSLHRSEGLGLTMSEAMCLGVPVIATGYSGNVDFMNDDVAMMVPWTYSEVGRGSDPYPPTARWAEPDLSVASELMRRIYSDSHVRNRLGESGRNHLLRNFSPDLCGARMRERLEAIAKETRHA